MERVDKALVEPESLSARALKAKYHPTCGLLNAELGWNPSRIWRSLLEGRDVPVHGLIRRIGDGQSTQIWQHNWLPRSSNMHPIVCRVPNPPEYVGELIWSYRGRNGIKQPLRAFFSPLMLQRFWTYLYARDILMIFGLGFMRRIEFSQFVQLIVCSLTRRWGGKPGLRASLIHRIRRRSKNLGRSFGK